MDNKVKTDEKINFLATFFSLFKAEIVDLKVEEDAVRGKIHWLDDQDEQEFLWRNTMLFENIQITKTLCEFLIAQDLLNGDRIVLSETNLIKRLISEYWTQQDAETSINSLYSCEVKMIDDDEETDSFFIHF
jgi:hypothetical protein